MSASDSYRSIMSQEGNEAQWWRYHRDHRLEAEARHAYWVEHFEESFWRSWHDA